MPSIDGQNKAGDCVSPVLLRVCVTTFECGFFQPGKVNLIYLSSRVRDPDSWGAGPVIGTVDFMWFRTRLAVVGVALAGCSAPGGAQEAEAPPAVVETTVAEAPVAIPRSIQFDFDSGSLGRTYEVQVKLPPSYDEADAAERAYPVLYLNDARYNFQVAAGITHLPMNADVIEEFIIVGIGYEKGAGGMDSRARDYTPSVDDGLRWKTGEGAAYLDFVADELIPEIEARFRVDTERRVLAGHSFGGLFGVYALLNRPEVFGGYIVSSPSLWFDDKIMFEQEAAYAAAHDDLAANVYMSVGGLETPGVPGGTTNEMVGQLADFKAALEARGYESLKLKAGVVEGATHETAFPAVLMSGILWHFATDRDVEYQY